MSESDDAWPRELRAREIAAAGVARARESLLRELRARGNRNRGSCARGGNRGAGLQLPQVPISSLPCAKPQTNLFLARAAAPPLLLHRFVPPLLRFESSLLRFEPPLLRFESSSLFSTDLCLGFTAPCAAPPVLASGSSGDRTTGTCEHLFLSLQLHFTGDDPYRR